MEKIYSNNTNNEKLFNKKLGTNYSYDKSLQQSPKLHSNKIRPLSGNLYYNNFISKGTSLKKQMKRLTNEELFNIIGPLNKKAGNINKYKKRTIKDFLGDKKIKIKTEINNNEEKNEKLSKNYDDKMKENQKLKEIKKNNEEEINNLKKSNKIFTQRNKERFANINKDLEGKCKEIDKLSKELSEKNEKLRSLSLNHKLNQNERDVVKKDLEEQKKINKQQNK